MGENLKYIMGYIPSLVFYWLGDLVSRVLHIEWLEWLLPLYSLFMNWSLFFNDWGGLDIWIDSKDE